MKRIFALVLALISTTPFAGENVIYNVNGNEYEGYWTKATSDDPLILLVHDWDGLTDYEKQRANMLNELGYNVFAVDFFGKGIRPTEVKDKKQHTGELYKDREQGWRQAVRSLKEE